MSDGNIFTLPQPDQSRADLAAIQADLEFVASRVARLPTRAYLCRTLIFAIGGTWALLAVMLLSR
jgi:hypothetical protein